MYKNYQNASGCVFQNMVTLGQAQLGVLDFSQTYYLLFQYRFECPNFNTKFFWLFWHILDKIDSRFGANHLFINTEILSWDASCFKNITKKITNVSEVVKFIIC